MKPQRHEDTESLHLLESYDYVLPKEHIAQHPVSPRDSSRLLLVSRSTQSFFDHTFCDLPDLLQPGDLLILNNTKVIPARLQSDRGEVLLVRPSENQCWEAMVHPGKHFKPGTRIRFETGVEAVVLSHSPVGRMIQFEGDVEKLIEMHGRMPLPPYIEREAEPQDRLNYQTTYARIPGSVAAPTAGLHFTPRVFRELRRRGISITRMTLHVGPGTFQPVKSSNIRQHALHPEHYQCTKPTWEKIQTAGRVIAVGTTTTRALETIAQTNQWKGWTNLFIYPGFRFQVVQGLITNFHLPRSSLLMLVSAFGGHALIQRAYQHAIHSQYRFYSYGDAMLIL